MMYNALTNDVQTTNAIKHIFVYYQNFSAKFLNLCNIFKAFASKFSFNTKKFESVK